MLDRITAVVGAGVGGSYTAGGIGGAEGG